MRATDIVLSFPSLILALAFVAALGRTDLALKELFIGGALDLNEVRHGHSFGDASERLPDTLLAGKGLYHRCSLRTGVPRANLNVQVSALGLRSL